MKVLFNGLCIRGNLTGVQYYAWHLLEQTLHNSPEQMDLHVLSSATQSALPRPDTLIRLNIPNRIVRIGYEHFELPRHFDRNGYDLLHCPAYILPWGFRGRSVLTVHDTIALDFPKYCKNSNALYFGLALKRSIRRASHIIAVSERVKTDILRHCDIESSRITTIHHGIDPIFAPVKDSALQHAVREKYALPDRYVLFVGNIEPKKNLARLIRAYHRLLKQTDAPQALVIVGQLAWKYADVLSAVETLNLTDRVRFISYADRMDLPALYSMADMFVFPSLYEGFGFPPLEAMACGTPVLTSRQGALPETTGGHAFYADAYSVEEMAARMEEALSNPAENKANIESGIVHAKGFTWEKTWEKTWNVYRSLV